MTSWNLGEQKGEILQHIEHLLQHGLNTKLLDDSDIIFTRNQLLHLFRLNETMPAEHRGEFTTHFISIDHSMEQLIDYGYAIGLIEENSHTYRDLLDAKIMGLLMPRPSQFLSKFYECLNSNGAEAATQFFYELSMNSRYIRMDRVKQNVSWMYSSSYGNLQITINMSKPEKDPREIAKLKELTPASYPLCLLCKENVGYSGRLDHPARQNLRMVPVQLQQEEWFLQYSPYVYYDEHSIVLSSQHKEMKITPHTFARLLDFVEQYPHYFIGSNADLPIVGGSILNHDHYQAGKHSFPMSQAEVMAEYTSTRFPQVLLSIVRWPLSVIRLQSDAKQQLIDAASHILEVWRGYSDENIELIAYTTEHGEQILHNTITPIARLNSNGQFELDLVLRNNRTSDEHPYGIFHPHEHLHHIKKENIGLIEVMGLAVLPARLKAELHSIAELLAGGNHHELEQTTKIEHPLYAHSTWIMKLHHKYGPLLNEEKAIKIVKEEVGQTFQEVLEHCGVFKQNKSGIQAFNTFINKIGYKSIN